MKIDVKLNSFFRGGLFVSFLTLGSPAMLFATELNSNPNPDSCVVILNPKLKNVDIKFTSPDGRFVVAVNTKWELGNDGRRGNVDYATVHDAQTGEPLTEAIGSEYGFVFKTIDNRYISFEGSVSGEEYQSVWAFEKYFDLSSKKMVNYEELEPVNFKINLSNSKAYIAGTNVEQIYDFKKLNYNDRSKNLKLVAENGKIVPFNKRKVAVNLSSDQYLALTDNEGNPTFEFYSTKTGERVLKAGWNVFGERFKLMYLSEIAPDGHSLFIPKDGDRSAYLVYDLNASETTGYFTFSNYIQDGWSRFFSDIGIIKKVKTFSINGSFVIRKANSVSSSDPPIILKDNTILTYGIERLGESKTKLNFQAVNIASLEVVNEFSIVTDRFEDALLGVRSDGEFLYIEGVKSKRVDGR